MDFAALERSAWADGSVARAYADHFLSATAPTVPPLLRAAEVAPGRRVLDLACGPGTVSDVLVRAGASVVSADLSSPMLGLARSRLGPGPSIVRGSALRLPFPSGTFDSLACNFGLLHFPEPGRALHEGARVLRRGGVAAWSVWGPDGALFKIIPAALDALDLHPELPPAPGFFRYATGTTFEEDLRSAGLTPLPTLHLSYRVPIRSAEAFWTMFREGSARTRAGLALLGPADERRVRDEVDRRLGEFRRGPVLELPASVVIGRGRRD